MSDPNAELETRAGFFARSRKAVLAFVGGALTAAVPGVIAATGDGVLTWPEVSGLGTIALGLGFATAVGVWWIPNKEA